MKKTVLSNLKRKISFVLIIAVLASSGIFSSCASVVPVSSALTLNGVAISNDVFTYFTDVAMTELGTNADENAIFTNRNLHFWTAAFKNKFVNNAQNKK